MKLSIALLGLVGLLAAGAAAFLVSGLRPAKAAPAVAAAPEADVLFAVRSMPALSVVEAGSVVLRKVPREKAPADAVSDPVAVVGKVLRQPVVEGQAFTPTVLAAKDSGINLASAVRAGMRAVSVSLSDYEALEGILYPGSVVDVLFSFKAPADSKDQAGDTVSMTLLKSVQVLAVEGKTILSAAEKGEAPGAESKGRQKQIVALMVTGKQAELLQLAQKFGSISLALRNPLDAGKENPAESSLSSQLSEILRKRMPVMAAATPSPAAPARSGGEAQWQMTVIRGNATEIQSLPMPPRSGT